MQNQRGSVTVLALVTMTFIGVILSGLLPMISNEVKMGTMNKDALSAQYAAEGGAKRAVVEFSKSGTSWTWLDNTTPYTVVITPTSNANILEDGSTPKADTYKVTSTGKVGKATHVIEFTTTIANAGNGYATDNAVYAGKTLSFGKNSKVYNAPVVSETSTSISNVTISPSQYTFENMKLTMPTINQNDYVSNRIPTSSTAMSGNYYVNGEWSLSKDETFTTTGTNSAVIYVNGDVNFKKSAYFNGNFMIIYSGNLDVSKDFTMTHGVLIGTDPTKNSDLKKNPDITGAIMVAGDLSFAKDTTITYDLTTIQKFNLLTGSNSNSYPTFSKWSSR